MDKVERLGYMRFEYEDDRASKFNESTDCTYALYGVDDEFSELMSIEQYWRLCRHFAAAMGFCEATIKEWFGGM